MADSPHSLIVDFLEWVAARPRSHAEVLDAWRSSCPRLTIWEDALADGLVACRQAGKGGDEVRVTQAGLALLARAGRRPEGLASSAAE